MKKPALAENRADQFASLFHRGFESWVEAGKLLDEWLIEDPRAFTAIQAKHPQITEDILNVFLLIGRRKLHPCLAVDGSPGAKRLALLPYADQARLQGTKIMVIVQTAFGHENREKPIGKLTKKEAEIAIGEDGVRSLAEQRKILKAAVRNRGSSIAPTKGHRPPARDVSESEWDGDAQDDEPVQEADDLPPTTARLPGEEKMSGSPREVLVLRVARIIEDLLAARSELAVLTKREHPLDRHIGISIHETCKLRLALKENVV